MIVEVHQLHIGLNTLWHNRRGDALTLKIKWYDT